MDASNEEPLTELARIFAAVILRQKARGVLTSSESPPDSQAAPLELSPNTALTVVHGS